MMINYCTPSWLGGFMAGSFFEYNQFVVKELVHATRLEF